MNAGAQTAHQGGCHCGAIAFTGTGDAVNTRVCHCRECQKFTGSAFFVRALFQAENVQITGTPRGYQSSADLTRYSCPACGTPLFVQRRSAPATTGIAAGAFSDPSAFPPQAHIWFKSRVAWLNLAGDLPRYAEFPP